MPMNIKIPTNKTGNGKVIKRKYLIKKKRKCRIHNYSR